MLDSLGDDASGVRPLSRLTMKRWTPARLRGSGTGAVPQSGRQPESDAMDDLTFALSERTRAALWPDRWLTLSEIYSELDDLCFWENGGLAAWSPEGRRHWLRRSLAARDADGRSVWLRMGGRYKHFDLVRQNRSDVDDYLTWAAEAKAARTRRAEELLQGQHVVSAVVLHPLAAPATDCLRHAERLTLELIAAVPDEKIAAKLLDVWSIYEQAKLDDVMAGLRTCRLFCALGTLYVECWRGTGRDRLRRAVERAEQWLDAQLCPLVEEETDEPAAQAG
jgi:hypothetical protein